MSKLERNPDVMEPEDEVLILVDDELDLLISEIFC